MDPKASQSNDQMGITFGEIRSDEPHEAVSPEKADVVSHDHNKQSLFSNHGNVFNVSKAFENERIEAGTIVSDKIGEHPKLRSRLGAAFKEWWTKAKDDIDETVEVVQTPLLKKEEPIISKVETRAEVVKSAATHATLAPKDDHHIVVQKIRTFKQDVARAKNAPVTVKSADIQKSAWTHKVDTKNAPQPTETSPVMAQTPSGTPTPKVAPGQPVPTAPSVQSDEAHKKAPLAVTPKLATLTPHETKTKHAETPVKVPATKVLAKVNVPETVAKREPSIPKKNIWVAPRVQPESVVLTQPGPKPVSQSYIPPKVTLEALRNKDTKLGQMPTPITKSEVGAAPAHSEKQIIQPAVHDQKIPPSPAALTTSPDAGVRVPGQPFHKIFNLGAQKETGRPSTEESIKDVASVPQTPKPTQAQPLPATSKTPQPSFTFNNRKLTSTEVSTQTFVSPAKRETEVLAPAITTSVLPEKTIPTSPTVVSQTPMPQRTVAPIMGRPQVSIPLERETSALGITPKPKRTILPKIQVPRDAVPEKPEDVEQALPRINTVMTPTETLREEVLPDRLTEEVVDQAEVETPEDSRVEEPVNPPAQKIFTAPEVRPVTQASIPTPPAPETLAPVRPAPQPPRPANPASHGKGAPLIENPLYYKVIRRFIFGAVVLLGIILGLVVVFFGDFFKKETPVTVTSTTIPTFIETPTQTPLLLEGTPAVFLEKLTKNVQSAPSGLTQLYPAIRTTGDQTRPATTAEVFTFLDTHISERTRRALGETIMFGSITTTKNEPFIVLQAASFETLFSGLIEWERYLISDFAPLFGAVPPAETTFKDAVRNNTPARILYDAEKNEILLYSFINQGTVVITTSSEALTQLIKNF